MIKYDNPKIAMCFYKKMYDLDNLIGAHIYDCTGKALLLTDSKLGGIKINSFGDIFDLLVPWLARRTLSFKWEELPSIGLIELRDLTVSHVLKKKWYVSPDSAWTKTEKLQSIELAKRAENFVELYGHLDGKMSNKYMKTMFGN